MPTLTPLAGQPIRRRWSDSPRGTRVTTTAAVATEHAAVPIEARSGLDPWTRADLPAAPTPRGLGWFAVVGPGVIVLGLAIGSGEFLLGPPVFVKYGLSLLW